MHESASPVQEDALVADVFTADAQPQVIPQRGQKHRMAAVRTTTHHVAYGWSPKRPRAGPSAARDSKKAGGASGAKVQLSKASQQLKALEQINLVGCKALGPQVDSPFGCQGHSVALKHILRLPVSPKDRCSFLAPPPPPHPRPARLHCVQQI